MGRQSPQLDQKAPVAPFQPGFHVNCLWIEPIYHRRGYEDALPELWLRVEVAQRLMQVAAWLQAEHQITLLVWDGWRPLSLQRRLWRDYRDELAQTTGLSGDALEARVREFVDPPEGEGPPPAHTTGGAVDLTLCSLKGEALDMGGEFDELTKRSHSTYYEHSDLSPAETTYRNRRRLLDRAMNEGEFRRLPTEWWHFEYGTANWAQWTGGRLLFDPLPAAD